MSRGPLSRGFCTVDGCRVRETGWQRFECMCPLHPLPPQQQWLFAAAVPVVQRCWHCDNLAAGRQGLQCSWRGCGAGAQDGRGVGPCTRGSRAFHVSVVTRACVLARAPPSPVQFQVGEPIGAMCVNGAGSHLAVGGREKDLCVWDLESQKEAFLARNVKHDHLDMKVPIWITGVQVWSVQCAVCGLFGCA